MATTRKPVEQSPDEEAKIIDPWSERRDVYVPREYSGQASQFVAINGRTYMVPTGKVVSVPVPVAEVLEHAQEIHEAAEAAREALRNAQQQ